MKPFGWKAPYLYFLRSVFLSSAVTSLFFFFIFLSLGQSLLWSLLFFSILLHQIVCAFTVSLASLYIIADLGWLVGNIIGLGLYSKYEEIWKNITPWAGQLVLIHTILCYYLMGSLSILAVIRIRLAYISDACQTLLNLFRPFNLLSRFKRGQDIGGGSVLFGYSIWNSHFTGETKKLIFARGSLAALFLVGIVAFSLVKTLTEPIRELRLIPTRDVHTPDTFTPIQDPNSDVATWGIVISKAINYDPDNYTSDKFASFRSAITVVPLWKDSSNLTSPDCVYLQDKDYEYDDYTQIMVYFCPSRIPIEKATSGHGIFPEPHDDFQPDLLVTVNFTTLGIPTDTIRDIPTNSVQVMVAMTNTTDDVVFMTAPTTLMPGVNLIGIASLEIHQVFKYPTLSLFGLFESTQSNVIAQIIHVFADPQAGISSLIVRSPEIATIRIIGQTDASQWTIIQDSKDKSFLNGLSQTGGLWTFLSGIFAAIFGSSLIRILFGIKPVSVFGLAHSWQSETIKDAYKEEYPAISEEINAPRDQRGLLCLLQDHIIDLSLTEETDEDSSDAEDVEDLELNEVERGSEDTRRSSDDSEGVNET